MPCYPCLACKRYIGLPCPLLVGQAPFCKVCDILGAVIGLFLFLICVQEEHGIAPHGVKVNQPGVHLACIVYNKKCRAAGTYIAGYECSPLRQRHAAAKVGRQSRVGEPYGVACIVQNIVGLYSHGAVVVLIAEDILVPEHLGPACSGSPCPCAACGAVKCQLPLGRKAHDMVPSYMAAYCGPLKVVFVYFTILIHCQDAVHIACQCNYPIRGLELAYLAVGEACL